MKKELLLLMATAIMTVLQSCNAVLDVPQNTSNCTEHYNICLMIDGTDRLSNQNDIPYVSAEEMKSLADNLCNNGLGTIYVSYIDKDCDNNQVAVFEWRKTKPADIGSKLSYEKRNTYLKKVEKREEEKNAFEAEKLRALNLFFKDCEAIEKSAYSGSVAKQKNGSDVNGAINKAMRLLKASELLNGKSYIVLVSDGCDNVGKQLQTLPDNTELFIVNSNVSKHHYGDIVSKEFVTFRQAQKYMFSIINF